VTPYYSHGGIQIFLGDCREVLPTLGRFDLLLTDPPYGLSIDTRNDFRGRGLRRQNPKGPCRSKDWAPVTGDDRYFDPVALLPLAPQAILWGANNYASRLPDSPCWLAWDRKCGRAGDSDATDAELAIVIGHRFQTVRVFRHMWIGFQRDSENAQGQLHPMQKPVALMRWCLGFFPEAKTVVDPYMGSGPVARACKDAGLTYVGIEIEERYAEIAAKRLAQEVLFA
jgi:hypothetical protein